MKRVKLQAGQVNEILKAFSRFRGAGAYSRGGAGPKPATPSAPSPSASPSTPASSATSSAPTHTAPAPPSAGGAGGPQGGPTSAPRGGKYIRRWWDASKGHWEYEYADQPHAQHHGITGSHSDDHTFEIPDHTPDHLHQKAQAGDKNALKDIYNHSKQSEIEKYKNYKGNVGTFKHPKTGEDYLVDLKFIKDTKGNPVQQIVVRKKGSSKALKSSLGWDAFVSGMRELAHSSEVTDANGNVLYKIKPAGKYDPETNSFGGVQRGNHLLEYKILNTKNSPIKLGHYVYAKDPITAQRKVERLLSFHRRDSRPTPSVTDQLQSGRSATQILQEGSAPVKIHSKGKTEDRAENSFSSPEEKHNFINQLARENEQLIMEVASQLEKQGLIVDYTPGEDLNPDSALYSVLERIARRYDPETSDKSVQDRIKASLGFVSWIGGRKQIGMVESHDADGATGGTISLENFNQNNGEDDESDEDSFEQVQEVISDRTVALQNALAHKLSSPEIQANPELQKVANFLNQNYLSKLDPNMGIDALEQPAFKEYANAVAYLAQQIPNAKDLFFWNSSRELGEALSQHMTNVNKSLFHYDYLFEPDYIMKSATRAFAMFSMFSESYEDLIKANVQYSHKDGNELYPKYYYQDDKGNLLRYSNAPQGHPDFNDSFGEPKPHREEFSMETHPQFFTADGRMLNRAPYPNVPVEWNQSYHPNDLKNLWAARWVNPVTGAHEYAYIDADIKGLDQMRITRMNQLLDSRLPFFRQMVATMFKGTFGKDKALAVMLALIDQGRFRVRELTSARVGDLRINGDLVDIKGRTIHADMNVRNHLAALAANRDPSDFLFKVPMVSSDGGLDYSRMRRIGPSMLVFILESIGISPEAFQTYHATQTYSMEVQNAISDHSVTYNCAHNMALLEVASTLGHDLDQVEDFEPAVMAIAQVAIDPVVIAAIAQACDDQGLHEGETELEKPWHIAVPHVSMNLMDRTEDEKEFSRWLHTAPLHNFLERAVNLN